MERTERVATRPVDTVEMMKNATIQMGRVRMDVIRAISEICACLVNTKME